MIQTWFIMYMLETYFDLKMDNAFCITIIASETEYIFKVNWT